MLPSLEDAEERRVCVSRCAAVTMVVEGDDRRREEVESRLADNWVLNARAAGSRARSILFSRIVLMLV